MYVCIASVWKEGWGGDLSDGEGGVVGLGIWNMVTSTFLPLLNIPPKDAIIVTHSMPA